MNNHLLIRDLRFLPKLPLKIQVSGLPHPEIIWLLNGKVLCPDLTHQMLVRENGIHSLVVDPTTKMDAGIYTCIASNKAGQSSFCLTLSVVGKIKITSSQFYFMELFFYYYSCC